MEAVQRLLQESFRFELRARDMMPFGDEIVDLHGRICNRSIRLSPDDEMLICQLSRLSIQAFAMLAAKDVLNEERANLPSGAATGPLARRADAETESCVESALDLRQHTSDVVELIHKFEDPTGRLSLTPIEHSVLLAVLQTWLNIMQAAALQDMVSNG